MNFLKFFSVLVASAALNFSAVAGDEFKIKLTVKQVNHLSPEGARVIVNERQKEVKSESVMSDGEVKLALEKGKLYDIMIAKPGFITHIIHNVHSEGRGKFDVELIKVSKNLDGNLVGYVGANRDFDDVKKMTIPAEYLSGGVKVVSQSEMPAEEKTSLSKIQKEVKGQHKKQKKIDKLVKKSDKINKEIEAVDEKIASSEITALEGEQKKLKLQESLVKVMKDTENNAY